MRSVKLEQMIVGIVFFLHFNMHEKAVSRVDKSWQLSPDPDSFDAGVAESAASSAFLRVLRHSSE